MRSPILVARREDRREQADGHAGAASQGERAEGSGGVRRKHRRDPEKMPMREEVGEGERRRHPSAPDCEGEEDDDGEENRAQNVILHDGPGRYEHDEHGHLRSDVDVLRECFPCSSSQNQSSLSFTRYN